MLIARRKFNEELTNSQEIIHRRVLTEEADIEEQINDLRALASAHDYNFRLYLTVNARDTRGAYHGLMKRMTDWSEELLNGHRDTKEKLGRISSEWKSELHAPENKMDSFFLFDYDDVTMEDLHDSGTTASLLEETTILKEQTTPHGCHIITRPFNYTEWESPIEYDELDTDGMLHLEEL